MMVDPARPASRGPVVLVADHELLYRWFAVECLEEAGYRAIPFATVLGLLNFLDRAEDDVIILVDERSLRCERLDADELLRHAASVQRLCVLGDDGGEVRFTADSHAIVPKPSDRTALMALLD